MSASHVRLLIYAQSHAETLNGGEFSFSGEKGLVLTGRMLSSSTAAGKIEVPPCGPSW